VKRLVLLVVGADLYGLSRTTLSIAERLAGEMDVEIWSGSDGPLIAEARTRGIATRLVPLPVLRRQQVLSARLPLTLIGLASTTVRLWRAVRKERGELSVVHALGAPSIGGLVVARAAGCPLVWSVHEVFGSNLERSVFGSLLRRADVRVACSRFVAAQLPGGGVRVIHSGSDVSVAAEPPARRAETRLICVGRLNRWKGQEVLLRAFAALPDDLRAQARIQLVGSAFEGDPGVATDLEKLRFALGLEESVEMLGERPDAQALMAEADIVVVPSQKPEPFGKVVVEGMALGRAVVATTPGGPAEVITDGVDGLLVPVGDASALTAALARLLRSPEEVRSLGRQAKVRAACFSSAAAADAYRRAYLEVLA